MPHSLAVAQISHRLTVFDDIRDDVQLGVVFEEWLAIRIRTWWVEFAKILAESDKLWVGKFLIVKDDDKALAPNVFNSFEIACLR